MCVHQSMRKCWLCQMLGTPVSTEYDDDDEWELSSSDSEPSPRKAPRFVAWCSIRPPRAVLLSFKSSTHAPLPGNVACRWILLALICTAPEHRNKQRCASIGGGAFVLLSASKRMALRHDTPGQSTRPDLPVTSRRRRCRLALRVRQHISHKPRLPAAP